MTSLPSLDTLVHHGEFWAGATGPAIPVVFKRSQGGYLNCIDPTTGRTAVCTGFLRRWDPRRSSPVGAIISTIILTEVDPVHGRYLWDWLVSDLGSVPLDSGAYVLQIDVIMPSGQQFPSQRALIEVLPYSPSPYS